MVLKQSSKRTPSRSRHLLHILTNKISSKNEWLQTWTATVRLRTCPQALPPLILNPRRSELSYTQNDFGHGISLTKSDCDTWLSILLLRKQHQRLVKACILLGLQQNSWTRMRVSPEPGAMTSPAGSNPCNKNKFNGTISTITQISLDNSVNGQESTVRNT